MSLKLARAESITEVQRLCQVERNRKPFKTKGCFRAGSTAGFISGTAHDRQGLRFETLGSDVLEGC